MHTDIWGRPQGEWATRVNPQCSVGPTHVHGIRQEDVAEAPLFGDLVPQVVDLLRGRALVAHNARFDAGFLAYEFGRSGWAWPNVPTLCTFESSRHFLPHLGNRNLADCCSACGVHLQNAHSALGDARATAGVLRRYFQPGWGPDPTPHHCSLVVDAMGTRWPERRGELTVDAGLIHEALQPVNRYPAYVRAPATVEPLLGAIDISELADPTVPGAMSYLAVLRDVLSDGVITADEKDAMIALANSYGLAELQRRGIHLALLSGLCREALSNGKISRAERVEVAQVAELLGLDDRDVKRTVEEQIAERRVRLSSGLRELPVGWSMGEPLRVDDRVVFTGECEGRRNELEDAAEQAGLQVMGSVSGRTTLLVTSGDIASRKIQAAIKKGTRVVSPKQFGVLLEYIQPAEGQ